MGAVVIKRLTGTIERESRIVFIQRYFVIDSEIVRAMIQRESYGFNTFAGTRIGEIQAATSPNEWYHVDGDLNISDWLTRGKAPSEIKEGSLWQTGPEFLSKAVEEWPLKQSIYTKELPEERKKGLQAYVNAVSVSTPSTSLISRLEERISDWGRQKRVLSTMMMFIKRCKKQLTSGVNLTQDIHEAELALIKMIQREYLGDEIERLCSNRNIKSTALAKLNPYIDKEGIMRVGGRIEKADIDHQVKHPCILPKKGVSNRRVIEWCHRNVKHLGRSSTTNEIRANGYWLLSINTQVRSVIFKCFRCRSGRGLLGQQQMSPLPAVRISAEGPFTYCGVDMFGPFIVKERRSEVKRYGAIFTCLSSRAIHLETTISLETDSFILALRRFVSRRGPVRTIRCDNGGNFIGCKNEFSNAFKEMNHNQVKTFLLNLSCDWIKWEHNPPHSSHMGGVWERMIRSVRNILSSSLQEHSGRLNDESLRTLFAEVEAIVNSRPISIENLNDHEFVPLTPNHLLTMKSKAVQPPPGIFKRTDVYCRKRWRCVQHLIEQFWKRWRKEYMTTLQNRHKWIRKHRDFAVGDIILLEEKIGDVIFPRNKWKMGIITEVLPSDDGLVRSAKVRLGNATSELLRPITKLVLLIGVEEM